MDTVILFAALAAPPAPADFGALDRTGPPPVFAGLPVDKVTAPPPRAKVDPPAAPPKADPPPAPVRTVAVTHTHLCPRCRAEWAHADDSFGKADDHRCPACNFGPVWAVHRTFPPGTRLPVNPPPATTAPWSWNQNNCPDGKCPTDPGYNPLLWSR